MSDQRKNTSTTADGWANARGEKWRDGLVGMEGMLAPIDEPLLQALQMDAPYRIADLGCGGGGGTLELARRAKAGSVVHGYDISPALIEAARERASNEERDIQFVVADLTDAKPMAPYERLVSRFGMMFFAEPQKAFANLMGWLAPEGRFAFSVWAAPEENVWKTVRNVLGDFLELPELDRIDPGPYRYAQVQSFLDLLEEAGAKGVDSYVWRGMIPVGGGLRANKAAEFVIESFGNFGDLLAKLGGDASVRAREALTKKFAEHEQDGVVTLPAAVHIVTGGR